MDQPPHDTAGTVTSSLNRNWLIKMVIFTVVLLGFGSWGLYDATILYPARGNEFADYAELQFLKEAKKAGKLNSATEIAEPAERFKALSSKLRSDPLEQTEFDWLEGLSRVGRLDPASTRIENPSSRLDALENRFTAAQQPKALAAYDIPLQWIFAVIGFAGAAWVLSNIVKSAGKKYTWEEAHTALTLPGGKRVTPEMLADVDKRKWHKYFCALVFNDGTEPVELDLLKYSGLEAWVLTLERTRFPDRAAAIEAEESDPAPNGNEPQESAESTPH